MTARKTMDDLACERGCMAAAIIADHATEVEARRGDNNRLLFDCYILGEELAWDPDRHNWDGPAENVLAMMANGLLHERDELRTIRDALKEERDRLRTDLTRAEEATAQIRDDYTAQSARMDERQQRWMEQDEEVGRLRAEAERLAGELAAAATSLETLSLSGTRHERAEFLQDMSDVRGYAKSRSAVANKTVGEAQERALVACPRCGGNGFSASGTGRCVCDECGGLREVLERSLSPDQLKQENERLKKLSAPPSLVIYQKERTRAELAEAQVERLAARVEELESPSKADQDDKDRQRTEEWHKAMDLSRDLNLAMKAKP